MMRFAAPLVVLAATTQACDLVPDARRVKESFIISEVDSQSDACLIKENCFTGSGLRTVLRFDSLVRNIGTTDCTIGWTPDCPRRIAEEQPDQFPFIYDTCHKHWHFTGLAEYFLFDKAGRQVSLGAKNGLCLMDNTECSNSQFNCENQGITAGCADVYDRDLDCQWIDITDLPGGTQTGKYIFQWRVNNQRALPETNYENNLAEVEVDLSTLERFNMDKGQVVGQCRERSNGRGTFRFTEGDPDSDPAAAAEEQSEERADRERERAERARERAQRDDERESRLEARLAARASRRSRLGRALGEASEAGEFTDESEGPQ